MSQSKNSNSQKSNSAGSNSPRGAKQIESDLEHNRSRMEDMLDELQARFSPDELIDQAKRYARRRSSDGSGSNLQEMVVRNPLPVALIGVGMAWLLLAGRNGSVPHEDSTQDSARNLAGNASQDGRTDSRSALGDSNGSNTDRGRSNNNVSSDRDRGNNSSQTSSDQTEDTRVVVTETALPPGEQSSETVIRASESSGGGSGNQSKRPNTGGDEQLTQVGAGAGHSDPSRGPDPGRGPDSGSTSGRGPGAADPGTSRPASR